MSPERRACIIDHIDAIARKPWRGEGPADQRAELDGLKAALRRRGELTGDLLRPFEEARAQIDRAERGMA